jgi:hypothetical protein
MSLYMPVPPILYIYSFYSIYPYSRSTYSLMSSYIVFVSIRYLRVFEGFDFVIELVGFDSPLIHLTSVISRRL